MRNLVSYLLEFLWMLTVQYVFNDDSDSNSFHLNQLRVTTILNMYGTKPPILNNSPLINLIQDMCERFAEVLRICSYKCKINLRISRFKEHFKVNNHRECYRSESINEHGHCTQYSDGGVKHTWIFVKINPEYMDNQIIKSNQYCMY